MLQIKPLSEELQKVAIEELGEVPSRMHDILRSLKEWLQQQPHLNACTDDQFLIQFLRGCKYSVEKAKSKIDHFYAFRAKYPEICISSEIGDSKFRDFFNTGSLFALPTPLHGTGPRIIIVSYNYSGKDYSMEDFIRYSCALFQVMMLDDAYAGIYGIVIIYDFAKFTLNHLKQLSISQAKRIIRFYETASPVRIKAVHIINLPSYAEQSAKLAISYAPAKLRKRVNIYGKNIQQLEEHLPIKYLPQEYGGDNGSLQYLAKEHNQMWNQYQEYFENNAQYGCDESLRLGPHIEWESEIGYGGSFRKLDVD